MGGLAHPGKQMREVCGNATIAFQVQYESYCVPIARCGSTRSR